MKEILIFSISLFVCLASFAQKQSEKEVKGLLCHKWKIDYAKAGDERFPLPANLGNTYLDIKSNGTVVAGDPNKQKRGKWTYDHKRKTFTSTTEKEPVIFELVKISRIELVMKQTIEGIPITMYLKRFN